MTNTLILALCLLSNTAVTQKKAIALPFKNLPYPIDSVTSCMTYTQRFNRRIGCVAIILDEDITFYSHASRNVRSLVSGRVVAATQILGDKWLVIVKRDKFFFTYSGLSAAYVKKGDSICSSHGLGRTGIDEHNEMYSVTIQLDTKKRTWDPEPIFNYQDNVPADIPQDTTQYYSSAIMRFKL